MITKMNDYHPDQSPGSQIMRLLLTLLGWLASLKIQDWQAFAGTFAQIAVGGYAVLQAYVLWRDKIKGGS